MKCKFPKLSSIYSYSKGCRCNRCKSSWYDYYKIWNTENPEKVKEYYLNWRNTNIEDIRKRDREQYHINKKRILKKRHTKENKMKKAKYDVKHRREKTSEEKTRDYQMSILKEKRWIEDWVKFFKIHYGTKPRCKICNKPLQWESDGHQRDRVVFDHTDYRCKIQTAPQSWTRHHVCNDVNKEIFLSCNFGILCRLCNLFLRKGKRRQILINLTKYIGGKNNGNYK